MNTLSVLIKTPDAILFEGEVKSVSSVNERGKFDILPYHSNFISIINTQVTVNTANGEQKKFPIKIAICKVYKNSVSIFCGIQLTQPLSSQE